MSQIVMHACLVFAWMIAFRIDVLYYTKYLSHYLAYMFATVADEMALGKTIQNYLVFFNI